MTWIGVFYSLQCISPFNTWFVQSQSEKINETFTFNYSWASPESFSHHWITIYSKEIFKKTLKNYGNTFVGLGKDAMFLLYHTFHSNELVKCVWIAHITANLFERIPAAGMTYEYEHDISEFMLRP